MEDDFLVLNIREYIKMGKAGEESGRYQEHVLFHGCYLRS